MHKSTQLLSSNFILKLLLSWILMTFSAFGVQVASDDFGSSLNGWSGSGVTLNNAAMEINKDKTATKTYRLGSAYANQTITVSFRVTVTNAWESNADRLKVYVDGSRVGTYYYGGGTHDESFTATAESNGDFELKFKPDTSSNNEWAWIDNITLNAIPIDTGCDDSLDTSANNASPGTLIADMHNITTVTSDCISGSSKSSDRDYYNFTVASPGVLTLVTSSPNGHRNYFKVVSNINGILYPTTTSMNRSLSYTLDAGERIIFYFKETGSNTDIWQVDLNFIPIIVPPIPPNILPIPNQNTVALVAFLINLSSFVELTNADPIITYTLTGTLPSGLTFDTATGLLSGSPSVSSTTSFNLTLSATDKDGVSATESFVLQVLTPAIKATDDSYDMSPGVAISGNVISDDTGLGLDTGIAINVTSNTNPSEGTLTINSGGGFTYTPLSSPSNSISFTYTITDTFGSTDTATVTITIGTSYTPGLKEFALVNPPETRNIVGGYEIAGNTVLCLTELFSGYGGTCHGQTDYKLETSNRHVSKFIDIDGDSGTWNSSSSYIELPTNYDQKGGKGVVWAGLFWQGRIVKYDTGAGNDKELRFGLENSSSYTLVETGRNAAKTGGVGYGTIDLLAVEVNKIKLKIDNGTYNDVTASTLYDNIKDTGKTYAAFADVTALLQESNLAIGKHTFTVANLTTNEGRENTPGIFGGWSLVVIYLEDPLNGSPKNISIYSGFDTVTQNNEPLVISGFRLPTSGSSITANLSLFSGEGEYRYGRTATSNNKDTIQISNRSDRNYEDMNGSSSPLNIFDAVMDGIKRDDITGHSNNLQVNNNGVDVDNFDVSDAVTRYRDADPLIQRIYIKYFSDNDYITPSMVAFSTELYQPKICYNYTLDIAGYVFASSNNQIELSLGGQTSSPITARISIQSQEGDFPLEDVNITYRIANTSQLQYITGSTALAPNGISSYIPAGTDGLNQTYQEINNGFGMYIGTGANAVPGPGGSIASFQTRYLKFDTEMMTSSIDTYFDMWIEYTVDYGSGPLSLSKNFNSTSLCENTGGYYPAYNIFNIASTNAETNPSSSRFGMPYNLYTQVVDRPFDLTLFSYNNDYLTAHEVNTSVEVELFNAGFFNTDTNVSCFNPDSNITLPVFIRLNQQSSVPFNDLSYHKAIQNSGFRIWYLAKPDGSFVEHQCETRDDDTCFRSLHAAEYETDQYCNVACASGGSGCYSCLRRYYGQPICSRDNFSIRPEAFISEVIDSNQLSETNVTTHTLASSTSTISTNMVAGYKYRFDVNATSYLNDDAVEGYVRTFTTNSDLSWARFNWNGSARLTCPNTQDENLSLSLFNGSSINTYSIPNVAQTKAFTDVGEYTFSLSDENWTVADWYDGYLGHHANTGFDPGADCNKNSSNVQVANIEAKNGCVTSSTHTHPSTGKNYYPLAFRTYPYDIDVSGLAQGGHSSLSSDFVYINTLDSSIIDDISYNIQGTFQVRDYNEDPLSNFVTGCYAEDTSLKLSYTYLSDRPNNADTPNLSYALSDNNLTEARVPHSLGTSKAKNVQSDFTFSRGEKYYDVDMKGAISMALGLNFDRDLDKSLNPRVIQFNDFNVSLNDIPLLHVDLLDDHSIFGNLEINNTISFYYAKVKPAQILYDDILKASIRTPLSILIYCNLGFSFCEDRNIPTADAQTSEFDWWKSWRHDSTNGDGKVILSLSTTNTALSLNDISITAKGENNTLTVSRTAGASLPTTAEIQLASGTDRWLLHKIKIPFYRVKFIGESSWAGYGKTGTVIEGNSNLKKNRRLEW